MILSDRTIKSLCEPPYHYEHAVEIREYESGVRSATIDSSRSIYNDGKPMIAPFVSEQVREVDEQKIVSYGLASYGYDVRLADEFKIFTNVRNAIIDPLNPDPDCFIEHRGDHCIIPPNSYILGHTIETFDIPRDVMVVAVGKCLAGDTLITDPDTGLIRRMDETRGMVNIQGVDTTATNINKYATEGLICNGRLPMVKVTTARGLTITATETHPLRKWNGWSPISELSIDDRIAVARREYVEGTNVISPQEARLLGYMTADGQCDTSGHSPVFTKADPAVMAAFINDAETFGFIAASRDEVSVRLVNRQGRGGSMERNKAALWLENHNLNVLSKEKTVPETIQTATLEGVAEYIAALFTCDSYFGHVREDGVGAQLEYYTTSELLAKQVQILLRRFGLFFGMTEKEKFLGETKHKLYSLITTTPDTIKAFAQTIGFIPGSLKHTKLKHWLTLDVKSTHTNWDTLPVDAWDDIERILKRLNISWRQIGLRRSTTQGISLPNLRKIAASIGDEELTCLANPDVVWDKVVDIAPAEEQLAYDYTVPEVHNFIASGIVVHNSTYARLAAIVNVTPIEPEFKGQVVIEIANCSPLPLKVYAGQGIAQFLFFKGDRPCEVSYADKGGKYQNQTGLTLARL